MTHSTVLCTNITACSGPNWKPKKLTAAKTLAFFQLGDLSWCIRGNELQQKKLLEWFTACNHCWRLWHWMLVHLFLFSFYFNLFIIVFVSFVISVLSQFDHHSFEYDEWVYFFLVFLQVHLSFSYQHCMAQQIRKFPQITAWRDDAWRDCMRISSKFETSRAIGRRNCLKLLSFWHQSNSIIFNSE